MPSQDPMPAELERKLYYDGIHLFNTHEFFEAHETWEDVWRRACGLKHAYYQGMIQCAVALEHYRRGNPRGVQSLFRSYPPKFRNLSPVFMGLDVAGFLERMKLALAPMLDSDSPRAREQIELDLGHAPHIELLYDPFETGEAQTYNRQAGF